MLIYPEKITVRSAMDNGEVIGFQASDFVYEHQVKRDIPQPKLSLAEAEKVLNPEFKVLYHRKALIKTTAPRMCCVMSSADASTDPNTGFTLMRIPAWKKRSRSLRMRRQELNSRFTM